MTDVLAHLDSLLSQWKEDAPDPVTAGTILEQAEHLLEGAAQSADQGLLHRYLNDTASSAFLRALGSRELQYRWAETTFKAIDRSGYTLRDLFNHRVHRRADIPLFQEHFGVTPIRWSYRLVAARLQTMAAAFRAAVPEQPRVAVFAGNCVDGACTDLACLVYQIFVTPLNIHFDKETLIWIFDRLDITVAVTDTEERYRMLRAVRDRTSQPFRIFLLNPMEDPAEGDVLLEAACGALSPTELQRWTDAREPRELHAPATVMFTSGSTGNPKGVVFSEYAIVTKRFARAAALPDVGRNEVLLCFLPLFHTFGRFFEMTGAIYWGGTYVFTGNPSAETLQARLTQVHPSGLISIPLRWEQLYDECLKRMGSSAGATETERAFREVMGAHLRWGISAAGFLHPRVFRFFQKNGVQLCSGFGMTEATGGITMTPPDEYREHSVGIVLPGVKARLSKAGELLITGPYVVPYLDPDDGEADAEDPDNKPFWLHTGDLFEEIGDGHLRIVDRIKDIYKNNRGQTIAPLRVEQKFNGVPGIKRTFLVGDGRDYNVLLIVSDPDDPVLHAPALNGNVDAYYHQIVTAANKELAPYERVVNIAVLNRDFDAARDELTPKGSLRRKNIEQNFSALIDELYQSNYRQLSCDNLTVYVPRWLYRDLGALEGDIIAQKGGLFNRNTEQILRLCHGPERETVIVGDLEYRLDGRVVDLDLFARQPQLWIGNPALIAFCPCKDGWDLPIQSVSEQVLLPWRSTPGTTVVDDVLSSENPQLKQINTLVGAMLFHETPEALAAVDAIEAYLHIDDARLSNVIRRRLEALARHPEEELRCRAYRILLLDEPTLDYSHLLPAFVQSGLSFLNENSIQYIAQKNIGKRRLEALRQRMHTYRTRLAWPTTAANLRQFERIFKLLVNFVKHNPEYYASGRAELANWILHDADEKLAAIAERYFNDMADWFQNQLIYQSPLYSLGDWRSRVEIGDEISLEEIEQLERVLIGTTFLQQAVMLAYDVNSFDLYEVIPGGIWISRFLPRGQHNLYRVSINMRTGDHYELLLVIRPDINKQSVLMTRYWMITIAGYPFGAPVIPRFGCCRPELGAMAMVYMSELTVWEKIREMSSRHHSDTLYPRSRELRKLMFRALTTFFTGWRNSNYQIVAGAVSLDNIAVPEPDFIEGASILSLTGWQPYDNPLSLVRPIIQNCYRKTVAHYPWTQKHLKIDWIFDACIEALGMERATAFLQELRARIEEVPLYGDYNHFSKHLDAFLEKMNLYYHPPLLLQNAIEHFREWEGLNSQAEPMARADQAAEVFDHYHIGRYPAIAHYYLYRYTYFVRAGDDIRNVFDQLLEVMFRNPSTPATRLIELYNLQSVLTDDADRKVFSRLVFSREKEPRELDVMVVGERAVPHVIVRSRITDKQGAAYTVRPPLEPAEIGEIIRLFIREKVPGRLSEHDQYLLASDIHDRIVGGVCYRMQERDIAYIDAITIATPFRGQGLGTALLEDFCTRMTSQGVKTITAKFLPRNFFMDRGFQVNKRWGGLVRFLSPVHEDK